MSARLLMVEDEMFVAMLLKDLLTEAGYRVVSAARLEDAMHLARNETIDGAILDINLHGETVYPLAQHLEENGVPFLFASAYSRNSLPEAFRERTIVQKPYTAHSMMAAVKSMLNGG